MREGQNFALGKIVEIARPAYLILENVANFLRHDGGRTWRWLSRELRHAGYSIDARIISPHNHEMPQIRERLFVVGARGGLEHFAGPEPSACPADLRSILEDNPAEAIPIAPKVVAPLEAWDTFLKTYPRNPRKPWFPIWAAEFGATYPFTTVAPLAVPSSALRAYKGAFGVSLDVTCGEDVSTRLPTYARTDKPLPSWKMNFLQLNRDLYEQNRAWIDPWLPSLAPFEHSFQKFEWNFDSASRSIWAPSSSFVAQASERALPRARPGSWRPVPRRSLSSGGKSGI